MPSLIEGYNAVIRCKHIDLMFPILVVTAPAMQENQGGLSLAAVLANDVQPILGTNRFSHRLGSTLASEGGREQQRQAANRE